MPYYESVFVARPDISAAQVEALTESMKEIVAGNGGAVTKAEYWDVNPWGVGPPPAGAGFVTTLTVGGIAVALASAVANTAILQGPGKGLDDIIGTILITAGAITALCAPLVWFWGREPEAGAALSA